jgi:hypothetical protein
VALASHDVGYRGQEHVDATEFAGVLDVAAKAVDEHRAGLDQSNTMDGAADLHDLQAARLERLPRTFPHLEVQATTPHLADKREVPIVSHRRGGRAR